MDIVFATMLSTTFAAVCVYIAHLIGSRAILNDNWNFAIYILITIAGVFMTLPYVWVPRTIKHIHDDYISLSSYKALWNDYRASIERDHFGCDKCKTGIYHPDNKPKHFGKPVNEYEEWHNDTVGDPSPFKA